MTFDDLPLFAEPPEVQLPPHADKLERDLANQLELV